MMRSARCADRAWQRSLFPGTVFLSLFRHLVRNLSGRVERMLGPIVFTDRAGRGSFLGCGRRGRRGSLLMTFLDKEEAAENGRDDQDDSGAHVLNNSRVRASDPGSLP